MWHTRPWRRFNVGRKSLKEWWPEVESNHRHADFQSAALPTELSGHIGWRISGLRERGIKPLALFQVKN